MSVYRHMVRPLLFRCDPEWIHERAMDLGERVGASVTGRNLLKGLFSFADSRLATEVGGLRVANPLGLAAGFDESGRVSGRPTDAPLGINLVETNTGRPVAAEAVVAEFAEAVKPFVGRADYIALNLNCPNTTGGISPFDGGGHLRDLLREYAVIDDLPPVFLKFTAHVDPARLARMLEAVDSFDFVKGFVFNLPPGKDYALKSPAAEVDPLPGTLCGRPVREMIDEALRFWYARIDRTRHKIIGVGGISSAEDAYRKIRLGASLVQLYSALVFKGPGIVREINAGLARLLARDGYAHVAEAVGVDNEAKAVV